MSVEQITPIILSFSALCLSLYTYFKHDAKIKEQNTLINQFQIDKLKKETESEKKAIVEANVISKEKGKRIIKVYNKGKATAKEVKVTFPENPHVVIMSYPSSINLKPQNSMEIHLQAFVGSPETLQIDFEWQDDFKLNNKDSQEIQI